MTDEPDNVVPMRGHTHVCASCGADIDTTNKLEGHADTCMQPELRMRRAEARILELINAVNTQTENVERLVARIEEFISHGKPTEDIEPDTKRSGGTTGLGYDWAPPVSRSDGLSERSLEALWAGPFPSTPGFTHPDAEPAEPPGEAPVGAEPAAG